MRKAGPIASASPEMSAPKRVVPAIRSVSRIISGRMSSVRPGSARSQFADQTLGGLDHDVAEPGEPLAMEGRLDQLPLAAPGSPSLVTSPLPASSPTVPLKKSGLR